MLWPLHGPEDRGAVLVLVDSERRMVAPRDCTRRENRQRWDAGLGMAGSGKVEL